jgi:hypothetical protein
MYTTYMHLAETHSPYFTMGLGIYYTATSGTFARKSIEAGLEPAYMV